VLHQTAIERSFCEHVEIVAGTGIIFCREAQKKRISIFVETSGRDIAMFK
jgi:hypothetical protein